MSLQDLVGFARLHQRREWDRDGVPAPPGPSQGPDAPGTSVPDLDVQPQDRPLPPDWVNAPSERVDGVARDDPDAVAFEDSPATGLAVEALAFYLPFHFYTDEKWGIYVRESGVMRLAKELESPTAAPGLDPVRDAWELLVEHEAFHAMVECAATRAEVLLLDELYEPYFWDRTAVPFEEALANASAFRRMRSAPIRPLADAWMQSQPAGYREYWRFTAGSAFAGGQDDVVSLLVRKHPALASFSRNGGRGGFLFRRAGLRSVPTYLVRDRATPWLHGLREFPAMGGVQVQVHTRDHPPPHFHVAIPPRSRDLALTWRDLRPVRKSDRALTKRQMTALQAYLEVYGEAIRSKLRTVYGPGVG